MCDAGAWWARSRCFARTRVLARLTLLVKSLLARVVPTLGPNATGVRHVFWHMMAGKGGVFGKAVMAEEPDRSGPVFAALSSSCLTWANLVLEATAWGVGRDSKAWPDVTREGRLSPLEEVDSADQAIQRHIHRVPLESVSPCWTRRRPFRGGGAPG